jgi:hypothetical protein
MFDRIACHSLTRDDHARCALHREVAQTLTQTAAQVLAAALER